MAGQEKDVKTAKKVQAKPTKTWREAALNEYQAQAHALVTHSFKGVNTNIKPGGGVRVIPTFDPTFPYACAQYARVPVGLSYANDATESVLTEQICAVFDDGVGAGLSRYVGVPAQAIALIQEKVAPILRRQSVLAPNFVNPRLRQILVDDGAGGDLCLTPLPSGGMSFRIKRLMESILVRRAQDMPNGASAPFDVDLAVVKVGGDKLQNAGRAMLVGAMQQAWRFSVPLGADDSMRQAFALHFRGISMTPNRRLAQAYGDWLRDLRTEDAKPSRTTDKQIKRTAPRLEDEANFIKSIVNELLERGDKARAVIAPHVGLALTTLTDEALRPTLRGLIDPSLRDDSWKAQFARTFARQIADVTGRDDLRLAGIAGRSAPSLEPYIMEALS
ncbi:MAG: hypothetical protein HIU89_08240 [Proteobacteria bacterium]|nr:hypothetical protein [Pseudomonadota bacterium]